MKARTDRGKTYILLDSRKTETLADRESYVQWGITTINRLQLNSVVYSNEFSFY